MSRAATVGLALASCLAAAAPASAQRLVEGRAGPVPAHLDTVLGPIEERGALVVFGADLGTRASRSLRIDVATVNVGRGIDHDDVTGVVECAGSRWLVTFVPGTGDVARWAAGVEGAPAVWSRGAPQRAPRAHEELVTDVEARCAAGRVVIGYVSDGLLVTQTLSPTVGRVRRTRVSRRGVFDRVEWVAASPDELDAVIHSSRTGSVQLVRVVAGRITHRRELGDASSAALALGARAVLVATGNVDGRGATLRTFARTDLAPGPTSVLSARREPVGLHGGRSASVTALWPGPRDLVAVAIMQGWSGPDYVVRRAAPGGPPLAQPARHVEGSLRLWDPNTGALGDAAELGEGQPGAGGWLGDTLVLWQQANVTEATEDGVRLGPTRIRRFTVAP